MLKNYQTKLTKPPSFCIKEYSCLRLAT